jgi:hypothetical protein
VWRSDAKASRPQQGAVRSIDMPSARITCNFAVQAQSKPEHSKPGGEQFSEPNRSQQSYEDFDTQAGCQPLFSSLQDEAYIGSGENDKRYRRQHPAS